MRQITFLLIFSTGLPNPSLGPAQTEIWTPVEQKKQRVCQSPAWATPRLGFGRPVGDKINGSAKSQSGPIPTEPSAKPVAKTRILPTGLLYYHFAQVK
jgi:hypothetical protein